jgi:hypothetical protein
MKERNSITPAGKQKIKLSCGGFSLPPANLGSNQALKWAGVKENTLRGFRTLRGVF